MGASFQRKSRKSQKKSTPQNTLQKQTNITQKPTPMSAFDTSVENLMPDNVLQFQQMFGNQQTIQMLNENKSKTVQQPSQKPLIIQRLALDINKYEEDTLGYIAENATGVAKVDNGKRVLDPIRSEEYKEMLNPLLTQYKIVKPLWNKYRKYLDKTKARPKMHKKALAKLDELSDQTNQLIENLHYYRETTNGYNISAKFNNEGIARATKMAQEITLAIASEQANMHNIPPAMLDKKSKMTLAQAVIAVRSGVGSADDVVDANEGHNQRELGGGGVSKPIAMELGTGNDEKSRVFKGNEATAPDGIHAGIDQDNTQTTIRLMASANFDKMIQSRLAASNQEFNSLLGEHDVAIMNGQVGTLQDFASGYEGVKQNDDDQSKTHTNFDLNDAQLQRQLANLQLFDMITGQIDRHIGNIMIDQGSDRDTDVTGIDSDYSFANEDSVSGAMGKSRMPSMIDYYFANAILDISADDFESILGGLEQSDIDAALSRFRETQAILQQMLSDRDLIRAPGDDDMEHGKRAWGEIDAEEYRMGDIGTAGVNAKADYVGELNRVQMNAIHAIIDMIKTGVNIVLDKYKGRFVIPYTRLGEQVYMAAREDDGSDLQDLIARAHAIIHNEYEDQLQGSADDLENNINPMPPTDDAASTTDEESESLILDLGEIPELENEAGFELISLLGGHRK